MIPTYSFTAEEIKFLLSQRTIAEKRLLGNVRKLESFPQEVLLVGAYYPGIWLELYTYLTAKKSGAFDDVQISVVVDWDGKPEANNLLNEIDVTATRGLRPLFVSCKIGTLNPAHINEIYVHNECDYCTVHLGGLKQWWRFSQSSPLGEK